MRIGINRGHFKSQGAVGFLNETKCASEIADELTQILKNEGHIIIECSVNNTGKDWIDSTKYANTQGLELLVSIHLNSHKNQEACGTETLYKSDKGRVYAERITNAISSKIGTYNRGAKSRGDLYILNYSNCVAVLVEALFVSSQYDAGKYNARNIALAIAEGILNKQINVKSDEFDVEAEMKKRLSNPDIWLELRAKTPFFDEFIRKMRG
jgi:N-acetylmuramoyl-L-alanine amidase